MGLALIIFLIYYALKGLYFILWWASPALLVLALIINWRVFPDTLKNWLDTLENKPLSGIISAAIAVLAFPFFTLYLFLKAVGYRKMESMKREFTNTQQAPQDEFVDFEELESRPIHKTPEEPILEEPLPPAPEKPKKPDNPYDQFFDR